MLRIRTCGALLALVLVIATACGGSASAPSAASAAPAASAAAATAAAPAATAAAPAALTNLRIVATGVDTIPFFAILQIAVDKGWFKEAGINATVGSGAGGGSTITPVVTGDADMTIGSPGASVLAALKEPNLKLIGPWYQANDLVWVSKTKLASAADLKGKTLAFSSAGSTTELIVKGIAAKTGAQPTQVGAAAATWVAAKSGAVFAAWGTYPQVVTWLNEGGYVVARGADFIPNFAMDFVLVNGDYAKKNPETLKSFWKVADKAFAWMLDKQDESSVAVAKIMKITPAEVLRGFKESPDVKRGYSIKVDPLALKAISDLMVSVGQITKPIDWKTLLDQQYLPADARATIQ